MKLSVRQTAKVFCTRRTPTRGYRKGRDGERDLGRVSEDRDFYLSILSATSSKREARAYLQRFSPPKVRLPYLGLPKDEKPPTAQSRESRNSTHASRIPENHANPATVQPRDAPTPGISAPTAEAEELHIALVKIRDIDSLPDETLKGVGRTLGQLKRLGLHAIVVLDDDGAAAATAAAGQLRRACEARAERIVAAIEAGRGSARHVDGAVEAGDGGVAIALPQLLLAPLSRGIIPVVTPLAFDSRQRVAPCSANDIIAGLASLFSAATTPPPRQPVSLDRIIFLDPLGGIPAPDRPAGAHLFINLRQEFADIAAELAAADHHHHLASLRTLRKCLAILPPTTSAVITTADAAAHANMPRVKNPLIHNLLTDKPVFSSSLPLSSTPATPTTLLKHGTPLLLLPSGTPLTSPLLDLKKLVALIEDSFNKTLDLKHYLARVNDNIAGLIIAGDYEGAAIMTWEFPPSGGKKVCYLDKFAVAKRSQGVGGVADVVFKAMVAGAQPGRLLGEAEGIVWRSRRKNVVNKWYFERAKGTWKLPTAGDDWTMFWTTEDVKMGMDRLKDYADVCSGIEPSLREPIPKRRV